MRSCSSRDCSGVVIETSSTFLNWCWRIMPRVSLPAAPASARKDRVPAVKRSGRVFSSTMLSRTRLVSGTSAVGMSPSRPLLRRAQAPSERGLGVERVHERNLFAGRRDAEIRRATAQN